MGGASKRSFDFVVALVLLVLLLPLLLLVAGSIKFTLGGPVLYRHKRIGFHRRDFSCLKFRTMVTNGDEVLRQYLETYPQARHEWETTLKLKDDPRVTPLGAILRKTSIDELPQLLNVLRGEMSLVGPRPVVSNELQMYGLYARYYLRSRPGLTGAWQISGRNDTTYSERVSLDTEYVIRWSFWGDIAILCRTIPAVLLTRGSY